MTLDKLDRIPWKTLTHAYGSAEDVPDLLRALRTSSPDEQGDGAPLYELFGNIWHQGTVYEATAYAVPFLIGLAKNSETPDRLGILQLLAEIAKGSSFCAVHRDPIHDQNFKEKKVLERDWMNKAHDAVLTGFDTFVELTKESGNVRFAAAHVLAQLHRNAARVATIICAMLEVEECSLHRAGLLLLLGQVGDRSESTLTILNHSVTDPDQTQRLAAGCSLSMLKPILLSAQARKSIMEAILTVNLEERFYGLPWDAQGDISCAVNDFPASLDATEIEIVADRFLTVIESGVADPHAVDRLINLLFPLCNPGPTLKLRAGELSPLQQRAVRAFAEAMEGGRRIFYGHFPSWGLPDTMLEWRALAAQLDPAVKAMSLPILAELTDHRRAINLRLLKVGTIIVHRHFGRGTVTFVEQGADGWTHLKVIFDDEGPKELSFPST